MPDSPSENRTKAAVLVETITVRYPNLSRQTKAWLVDALAQDLEATSRQAAPDGEPAKPAVDDSRDTVTKQDVGLSRSASAHQ
jgi:hypothetical protein